MNNVSVRVTPSRGVVCIPLTKDGLPHLCDEIHAFRRRVRNELSYPDTLLSGKVEVHMRSAVSLKLPQNLPRWISQHLCAGVGGKVNARLC